MITEGAPMSKPRTSLTHPLRIDTLVDDRTGGTIGITFCPGKQGDSLYGSPWARDLDMDLDAVKAWGALALVTLVETHELQSLGVPGLGVGVRSRGIDWHHWPIQDLDPPGEEFERLWSVSAPSVLGILRSGGKVVVHCRGGVGRAGTVATLLAIELGDDPDSALRRVRKARPGAVETIAQERYVRSYRARLIPPSRGS